MPNVIRELSKLPSEPGGVCEIAEQFIAEWFGPLAEADGCEPYELEDVERKIGFRLPSALRWAYNKLGRRDDLLRRQDPLQEIENLGTDEDVLVFRTENQRCALWGVRITDAGREDPAVVWKNPQDGDSARWEPYQDRFSAAMLELIFSESMLSHGRHVLHRELEDGVLPNLAGDFELLPELDHVFWPIPEGPVVRWFGGADVLLRSDGETWLWIYARTPAALEDARTLLPGDWNELDA